MNLDRDKDGKVSEYEQEIIELEQKLKKSDTQRNMAWLALFFMLFFTGLLFTPFIPIDRVTAIGDLIGMFFVAQASIVGAYMGISAWMSKK